MNLGITDFIGYIIGLISIILSIVFYRRSQKKHRERLARLLDPHIIHQDLLRCRDKIASGSSKGWLRIFNQTNKGIEDLAILQQTIQNVQKYVLVVRSENYEQYDTLLAQALDYFENGANEEGIAILNKAIVLLAAEARVLGD